MSFENFIDHQLRIYFKWWVTNQLATYKAWIPWIQTKTTQIQRMCTKSHALLYQTQQIFILCWRKYRDSQSEAGKSLDVLWYTKDDMQRVVFFSAFPPWRARASYFPASGCTYMRTWKKKTKNCPIFFLSKYFPVSLIILCKNWRAILYFRKHYTFLIL